MQRHSNTEIFKYRDIQVQIETFKYGDIQRHSRTETFKYRDIKYRDVERHSSTNIQSNSGTETFQYRDIPVQTFSFAVSTQDGIVAQGKDHMRSALPPNSLPEVALETVPMSIWLDTDCSRSWRVERRSTTSFVLFSFLQATRGGCSGLSMLRKLLKPLNTSALPKSRSIVMSAVLAILSACSFPLTPARLVQ